MQPHRNPATLLVSVGISLLFLLSLASSIVQAESLILWKTAKPVIKAVRVTDTSVSLTWRTQDLNPADVSGFMVRWSRPGGVKGSTILLPGSARGVVLGSLQPGTKHTILVVAIGADGKEEVSPPITAQTKPGVTPSISPIVTQESTPDPIATSGAITSAPTSTPVAIPANGDLISIISEFINKFLTSLFGGAAILIVLVIALKILIWVRHRGEIVEDGRYD